MISTSVVHFIAACRSRVCTWAMQRQYRLPQMAALAGVSIIVAGSLTGCSNNPYPPGETAQPTLYRALGDDPKSFDPSIAYDVDSATVIDVIYPSYLQYHYLKRDPFELDLCLGAAQPKRETYLYTADEKGTKVQKKGESWTFQIKPGLHFQDDPCFPGGKGREITGADFLYSFRRMADPAVSSPIAEFFGDKIIGLDEYSKANQKREDEKQKPDYNLPVAGLVYSPEQPYQFRILLNQPYPQLRYLMAMHFTSPLAHEAVDKYGEELARHPVGCGTFVLSEYVPKSRITLTVNPNRHIEYYPADGAPGDREAGLLQDAGKQLPLVNKVVYTIVREGVTSWNLFLQGYLDTSGVTQQNFQQVMAQAGRLSPEMTRKGVTLHRDVGTDISYYAFNMKDPTFGGYTPQHKKLRQAISLAVNSQEDIDLLDQGLGRPAEFIIPPGLFGFDPEFKNPYRQPDVARAKALLTEAGYPSGIDPQTGKPLTLYFDNYATTAAGRQLIGLTTKQIQAIGVHVESRAWRYPVFQDKVRHSQFQFMHYGWVADYPDPENFLFLLYGPNRGPGPNDSSYDNPEYNKLFDQMRIMDDGPARLAIIKQMRALAVEDCPWIYGNHSESYGLTQPWMHNYKPHPVAIDSAKYEAVDGPMRVRLQSNWNHPNYLPGILFALFIAFGSVPAARVVQKRRDRSARRTLKVSK